MKRTGATAIMAIAATTTLALTGGTANANPESSTAGSVIDTSIVPGINYKGSVVGRSVVFSTDLGSLSVQDGEFRVLDTAGNVVGGIPLTYQRDGKDWPIAASIDGRTATLTPSTDPADAQPTSTEPMLKDVDAASDALFNQAISNAFMQLSLGVALGTLIGTAIGAGIGCVAGGAAVGAAVGVPTVGVLAIPGFLGGCVSTAAVTGPIGGMVGMIVVGVPAAVAAGIQFFNTVNPPAPQGAL
ncbi:hypothetical protein [Nocardia fusca]|uniref:hypothetical protein n=1 Tax=Nocardia fusca TaxID=941183 RepID=UPI0007A743CA|nr:hypothetical protein [Nocardia fusca]